MKIRVRKNVLRMETKCPHCGANTFVPLNYSLNEYALSVLNVRTRSDIVHGDISIGGPGLAVYYKRCSNCGFIAPFDARVVEERGKL